METSTAVPLASRPERGIYCDAFPDRLEYYVITSRGEERDRVYCALDMEDAPRVIAGLWNGLRDDPLPLSSSVPAPVRHWEKPVLLLLGRD